MAYRPAEVEQAVHLSSDAIRVVVADDDERFRRVVGAVLADEEDIEIVGEAGDARVAVMQVLEWLPEVVLLDISMPRGGGIEAARLIRRHAPATNIMMLTASDEDRDVYACLKAGASGYLLKQQFVADLAGVIRAVAQQLGVLLSPAIAARVLDEFGRERAPKPSPTLSDREIEVLRLVARGRTNEEIAFELFLSSHTVKRHVANILAKLQERTRADAVMRAVESGLLPLDA